MSTRVLSTDEAKTTITQMKALLDGGLESALQQLKSQGTTLSDPNVWDGTKAVQFRGCWQDTATKLDALKVALADLHRSVDLINVDIMAAGGNS